MELKEWHYRDKDDVLKEFQVDEKKGITYVEAMRRLELVGHNELRKQKTVSPIVVFFNQFKDFMIIILLMATLISGMLGEYADAITIIAIVFLNAILGFVQEYRAEKSMEALKKLIAPDALVIRNGVKVKIPARELVPGDIVALETGDIVPADLRILEANQLEVEESALTGESLPVKKCTKAIKEKNVGIGDRLNMGYSGTTVTRGKALGVVVYTGMETEMGQIAGLIQKVQDDTTPLQKRLEQLGKWLVVFCLVIVLVVVVTGILRGEDFYAMILTGVSLAVAAIPEGLPAIVTIALAVGVQKMIKKNSIIRKLPAVETLGCATVICSDKTGTLTQNEMTVRKVFLADEEIDVTGEGYEPKGEFHGGNDKNKTALQLLSKIAALCNDSSLNKNETAITGLFRNNDKSSWKIIGDPTEGALLVLAMKAGMWREKIENKEERVYSLPFDSTRKRMSVIYTNNKHLNVYTKGAPDIILERCSHVLWEGKITPLTVQLREKILSNNDYMAKQALRVLGLAFKELPKGYKYEENEKEIEDNLVFVGLAGMIDPPRNEAAEAVSTCKKAGIKTVMITGDHKITAQAVASELKIYNKDDLVLTGNDLDNMSDKELKRVVNKVSVYARVSPKHKLRIVKALKKQGQVVAMTGDGVNDAPAVKEADIGISMGISGTDVTKESSSMILGDDNFATIVSAVKEGRAIYDNIRKFIRYLLSCNVGEVLTMFVATLIGLPLPLLPIQILWVNLVTDGLPAMALGVDPADPDIMKRDPRHPKESIFAHGLSRRIIVRGTLICISTLAVFIIGFYTNNSNLELARTMAFSALVFSQLFHVFDCRSEKYSIFEIGLFSNPFLVGAVSFSVLMHLSVIYLPFLQPIFKTQSLGFFDWFVILSISAGTTILQLLYRSFKRVSLRKTIFSKA
ncbi:Ca2+-transporting ATPase [Desulfonispora thiosulfatigenes DSM 11270]|uniref:P-type Ca(2+) transporter n=1 Tax=Desulfonispora thiosulfatigenes DSM 11270 TaxID=656914 RepID=A0A1W1VIW6_DESTI|nr:Ca2+-transporting ATPase [Desulfonispora thiosulfatigenes DSM 11270]